MATKKRKNQAGKESPKSDESTAPQKNQQVRQIKTAEKGAARCGGASDRDTYAPLIPERKYALRTLPRQKCLSDNPCSSMAF